MRGTAVATVGALILLATLFIGAAALQPTPSVTPDIHAMRAQFEEEIKTQGGVAAYIRFLRTPATINEHVAAHIFGESLYAVEGVNGARACGAQFHYGCFHGFFMQAISAEGLSVVDELNTACREASAEPSLDCLHGIGHGLSEFMGSQKLTESLATCKKIEPDLTIEGCLSGAFMEYNVPRVVAEDGTLQVDTRPLEGTQNPLEPCLSVDSEFQPACYHELPRWWKEVYPDTYDTIGGLCTSISDPVFRRVCFHGLGVVASDTGTAEHQVTIQRCQMIREEEGKSICLQQGAYLSKQRGNAYDADVICATLPYREQAECPRAISAMLE